MIISHILYATDLDACSAHILNYVLDLTEQFHSKVSVVHAIESPPDNPDTVGVPEAQSQQREAFRESVRERVIDALADEIISSERNGLALISSVHVAYGSAADVILDTSRQQHVDLIVLGSHATQDGDGKRMGSVITPVLHGSRVPVMIVPMPAIYAADHFARPQPQHRLQ